VLSSERSEKNKQARIATYAAELKDGRHSMFYAFFILILVGCYTSALYLEHTSSPFEYFHHKSLSLSTFFKKPLDREKEIETLEETLKKMERLENCTTNACADEMKGELLPWLSNIKETAKKAHELDVQYGSEKVNDSFELSEIAEKTFNLVARYKPSDHNEETASLMNKVIFAFLFPSVPKELSEGSIIALRQRLPELIKSMREDLETLKKGLNLAGEMAHFKSWNSDGSLAYSMGVNEDVDHLRHQLEDFGLTTNEALILIGVLGPNLQSKKALINCIIKHRVESSYTLSNTTGNLEWNGLTTVRFILRMLFADGLYYVPQLFKIWLLTDLLKYLSFGYFLVISVLNHVCHVYEKMGEFDTYEYSLWRLVYNVIKDSTKAASLIPIFFLVAITVGIGSSLALEISYLKIALLIFFYVCLKAIASWQAFLYYSNEWTQKIADLTGCVILIICFARVVVPVLVWIDGSNPHTILATHDEISRMVHHIIENAKQHPIGTVSQILLIGSLKWIKNNYKIASDPLSAKNHRFDMYKTGRKQDDEWTKICQTHRKWKNINRLVLVIGWTLPIIAILLKSYFEESDMGHLSPSDGGINYIWSLFDMASLPTHFFRIRI